MKQKPGSNDNYGSVKKKRQLHPDEEALWQQVRQTVQPISTKRQNLKHWLDGEPKIQTEKSVSNDAPAVKTVRPIRQFPAPDYSPPISRPVPSPAAILAAPSLIDDKTARKLVKGKQAIDSRIDLHGMTQERAHRVLQDFIFQQYFAGSKILLVITGKGRMQEGILRNAVPRWLREPQLAEFVSAFRMSHISHGGEGALYVRLRNKNRLERRKK